MNVSRIALSLAATVRGCDLPGRPGVGVAVEIVREYREVPGAGVFTTCAEGPMSPSPRCPTATTRRGSVTAWPFVSAGT